MSNFMIAFLVYMAIVAIVFVVLLGVAAVIGWLSARSQEKALRDRNSKRRIYG